MEAFYPGQRWTSEAEPELGLGRVIEISKGRVRIDFPHSGQTRLYAAETAPLRRQRFKAGETVVDVRGQKMKIERVLDDDELIRYLGQGRILPETELGNVTMKHGAEERLQMGDVDTPAMFALRRRTLQYDHDRRISPVSGFLGSRIDLIPHQLYIAHEVSARYAPRVLLSDEVGLGKTIEACLILHRLLMSGRISRVMVLVPDSLVHQWFVELLRRFNLWFHIFDEKRCAGAEKSAPEGNPFLDDQLILCSSGFLAGSPKRAQQAKMAGWDMLVVDEAHHLAWTQEKASPEYTMVESLSRATEGLLLLTATPEQLGLESHFARLRLLDPDRYADFDAFQLEAKQLQATARLMEKLQDQTDLTPDETQWLGKQVGALRMAGLRVGNEAVRNGIIQDLLDQHGPGRVIFRNRRSAMQHFPKRCVRLHAVTASGGNVIEGLEIEFQHDLRLAGAQAGIQQYDFDEDPRVEWLLGMMAACAPAKVLLICNRKEKLFALESTLRKRDLWKVAVFHEDLSLILRDRNAAWFADPEGARLLLCSEIGSEGRNFQFAHHLVLFDLPLHPELLEQRIGRLDRIGQTEDIQIHVPFVQGSPQEVLMRWYQEGLNAFEENLEGGDHIAKEFTERLLEIALNWNAPDAPDKQAALIRDTHAFQTALKGQLAAGRDRLLEMNSFRPEIAAELVQQIRAADQDPVLEAFMVSLLEQFNIEIEDLAPRTYLLHADPGSPFPRIPEEGVAVTFERSRALAREEMNFLSWDHPMVTDAIDLVVSTGLGNAAFGVIPGGTPGLRMELIFVVETAGTENHPVNRFLPKTPIRVVLDQDGADLTSKFPIEWLQQHLRPGLIDDLLEHESYDEEVIEDMLDAGGTMAASAAESVIAQGLQRLHATTDHEILRLKALQQKNNHIRPEEIQIAEAAQAQLDAMIRNAGVRLDAVLLIQKGEW